MAADHALASSRCELVVVLGTGTEVGKTWVTAALASALRDRGRQVLALKPIETGVASTTSVAERTSPIDDVAYSDAELLARASSLRPATPPYRFREPISPHLAARREGLPIELATVISYVASQANEMTLPVTSFCLVETAGGCFTPLGPGLSNVDLALSLEPAHWVLVAPDALGVLHELSATLGALRARGRDPNWVVLSAARGSDASTGTNAGELRTLGIAEPIACLEHGSARGIATLADALLAARRSPR